MSKKGLRKRENGTTENVNSEKGELNHISNFNESSKKVSDSTDGNRTRWYCGCRQSYS